MNRLIVLPTLLSLCTLCGCTSWHFKPDSDHTDASQLPASYATTGDATVADKWWTDFNSKELNALIDAALRSNLTLSQAQARLRQAGAGVASAQSSASPQVNADAGTTHGRERVRTSDDSYDERVVESYSVGVSGSYEVDLWGRVAALEEAAQASFKVRRWDYEAAAMSIAAETTLKWLELTYLRQAVSVLSQQVETNKKILELTELRFRRSKATALDVLQKRRAVAQTESLLPPIHSQIATAENQLALLLGLPASGATRVKNSALPDLPPLPQLGLPSELLDKRPDVKAAWDRLTSAEWSVAVAKADRLPSLKLTGTYKTSSPDFDQLFRNWLGTLAANLIAPIIDGGRRKAEVERAKAVVDERLASYRETVLVAFKEVADALALEAHQTDYLNALNTRLKATVATRREAQSRYVKGLVDYLPVLQATIDQQSLERDILRATYQRISYRIQLHRALGGTWTQTLAASKPATKEKNERN